MDLWPYLKSGFCEGRRGMYGSRYVFRDGGRKGRGWRRPWYFRKIEESKAISWDWNKLVKLEVLEMS